MDKSLEGLTKITKQIEHHEQMIIKLTEERREIINYLGLNKENSNESIQRRRNHE